MLRASSQTVHRARRLRGEMTLPEILLWRELRRRPGNFKFRKQHPSGTYVLDFFCAESALCIEVDGQAHDRGDQPAFDQRRADWLRLHDIQTLHILAADVLSNLDGVVTHIVEACRAEARPPAPRHGEQQGSP